ncbi:MAG TPA: hypothetical protein VMX13_07750 [Sedimentisphaerales bacterium]|nr:hypothetical protein [Sedimentisphaerales bacterium]
MSRGKVITLGVFTAWPFVYMVLFMCMMFGVVMSSFRGGRSWGAAPAFWIIFPLHLLTMVEIPVLLVIYIVYLFRTSRVAQDKKALWAVVLFLGNVIAMPVFWYLYIWKEGEETRGPEGPPY